MLGAQLAEYPKHASPLRLHLYSEKSAALLHEQHPTLRTILHLALPPLCAPTLVPWTLSSDVS